MVGGITVDVFSKEWDQKIFELNLENSDCT